MPLHLDILDVGQGDGMVLWLPNGKAMMIDYGSTKNKALVKQDSFKYFLEHTSFKDGKQELEWLVLTHGDIDHYNLIKEFLTTFGITVRNVLHGGLESDYKGLIQWLRERKNPADDSQAVIVSHAGRALFPLADNLGAEVMVIATGVEAPGGGDAYIKNSRSTILRIVYKGIGLMLTGDATQVTELATIGLIRQNGGDPAQVLAANVLKLAHHGSHRTSNHAGWLYLVNPNFVFITSDRSGALDPDQKPTGHRLPQALTIDLVRLYAKRLQTDCVRHPFVMSKQTSDYDDYDMKPDVPNQKLVPPTGSPAQWVEEWTSDGIFSTLAKLGTAPSTADDGADDIGEQWRVTITDTGGFDILSTRDWKKFEKIGVGK